MCEIDQACPDVLDDAAEALIFVTACSTRLVSRARLWVASSHAARSEDSSARQGQALLLGLEALPRRRGRGVSAA
jgi:hypothetical protein